MNFEFLSLRNCRSILPPDEIISRRLGEFDRFLGRVNSSSEEQGLITRLMRMSQNQSGGLGERLLKYDADIGLEYDERSDRLEFQVKPYYKHHDLRRPEPDQRVVAQFWTTYADGTRWGYKVPLQVLLKHWGDAGEGYMCYMHTIGLPDGELSYAGITRRNWLQRLSEHLGEVRSGSRKLFHEQWRGSLGLDQVAYGSELLDLNLPEEEAMKWEEWFVDEYTLHPKGLNMIPGGKKGLAYLHKLRVIGSRDLSFEDRERAIARFCERDRDSYQYLADLWSDDAFYWRVINARNNTLSLEQIREARHRHSMGESIPEITIKIGALNETQVKNLLSGRTYRRVT